MSSRSINYETDGFLNGQPVYCPICNWRCVFCDTVGLCRCKDPYSNCGIPEEDYEYPED